MDLRHLQVDIKKSLTINQINKVIETFVRGEFESSPQVLIFVLSKVTPKMLKGPAKEWQTFSTIIELLSAKL